MDELRERFAREIHDLWVHWMRYLFSKAVWRDGEYFFPEETFDRWRRQVKTSYDDLPEKEKESDRKQVDRFLQLLLGPVRDAELKAVNDFYQQVCERAEAKMEMTECLEGAHYAAMQEILKEWEWHR